MTHHWAWYALIFWPIAFTAIRQSPRQPPRPWSALLFVLSGLGAQGWAIASQNLPLGRVGLLSAIIGLLRLEGRGGGRALVLLMLCVPIPTLLMRRLEPVPSVWLADAVASLARWRGLPSLSHESVVEVPAGLIVVSGWDLGLQAGLLAFGLLWFVRPQTRRSRGTSSALYIAVAVIAVAAHLLATLLLFSWIDPARADAARFGRDLFMVSIGLCLSALAIARRIPA